MKDNCWNILLTLKLVFHFQPLEIIHEITKMKTKFTYLIGIAIKTYYMRPISKKMGPGLERTALFLFWRQNLIDSGFLLSLRWRHNGHDSVSNHQRHHCLLNRLFGCRSKKTSKLRVTGLCVGTSPGTGEFPAQMVSNAENVSIWWRHHVVSGLLAMKAILKHVMSSSASCQTSSNKDAVTICCRFIAIIQDCNLALYVLIS